jgi:hypothetical protein
MLRHRVKPYRAGKTCPALAAHSICPRFKKVAPFFSGDFTFFYHSEDSNLLWAGRLLSGSHFSQQWHEEFAHQDKELNDVNLTRTQLGKWIAGLHYIYKQP